MRSSVKVIGVEVGLGQVLSTAVAFGAGILVGEYMRQSRIDHKASKHASSLRTHGRTVSIVTTAALPWRTGRQLWPSHHSAIC